jgi:CRP/FNR family transcriptional regulator, cyclic AMP receptor protein
MPCDAAALRHVPFFSLLDNDELAVLASHVEMKRYAARQRIYKIGDLTGQCYILVSGSVEVKTIDVDQQELVVGEPAIGEIFGFAAMIDQTPHQTSAIATSEAECVEIDRTDIAALLERKPHAGLDLLTVLGRQFHASHQLVRSRSYRNINEVIEADATVGDQIADSVAKFGGSWSFIISFSVLLLAYTGLNLILKGKAWDPYPFILLNLFLSALAAFQAPVIMMSQNRQDAKDRLRGELDYDVNRRAEAEIQSLSRKLNLLGEKISDIEDLLRERLEVRTARS